MNNVISFYPEMKEKAPENVVGNATIWGDKWNIEAPLTLKGRGITLRGVLQSKNLTEQGQYKTGWNEYVVTNRALASLPYRFARVALLD